MVAIAVVLEPEARPGGLASVVFPLPDGWQRGVEVMVGAVGAPLRVGPCAVDPSAEDAEPGPRGSAARFDPVFVRQGVLCSMLGRPDTEAYARTAARISVWQALSDELYDGAATGNPFIADTPTDLGATASIEEAVGLLEAAAWTGLNGALAVVHVPLDAAARLGDIVYRDGSVWRTRAGNLVAIHGTGSDLYVTGQIWAAVGAVDTNRYDNHANNASEGWADIAAIAVFDPSFVATVELEPPCACPEVS